MTVRQDRMVEMTWRQDFALDEAKVETDVGVSRIEDETRMAFGVHRGLVQTLSKLAPHGIEHHFSEGTQPRVVFDFLVLQLDAFMLEVLSKVLLTFGFVFTDPGWPPAGFLLDLQPGVHVISEQSFTRLVKMPDLIDVQDVVPQVHRFR